jgi:hypothetical protein
VLLVLLLEGAESVLELLHLLVGVFKVAVALLLEFMQSGLGLGHAGGHFRHSSIARGRERLDHALSNVIA